MDDFSLSALTALMRSSGLLTDADMAEIAALPRNLPPSANSSAQPSELVVKQTDVQSSSSPPRHAMIGGSPPVASTHTIPGMLQPSLFSSHHNHHHDDDDDEQSLERAIHNVLMKPEETSDQFFQLLSAIDRHPPVQHYAIAADDDANAKEPLKREAFDIASALQVWQECKSRDGSDEVNEQADAVVVAMLEAFLKASAKPRNYSTLEQQQQQQQQHSPSGVSSNPRSSTDRRVVDRDDDELELVLPAEKGGNDTLHWMQDSTLKNTTLSSTTTTAVSDVEDQKRRMRSVQFDNFVIDEEEEAEEEVPNTKRVSEAETRASTVAQALPSDEVKDQDGTNTAGDDVEPNERSRKESNPDEDNEEDEDVEVPMLPETIETETATTAVLTSLPSSSPQRELTESSNQALLEALRTEVIETCDDTVEIFALDTDFDYEANIHGKSRREME